MYRKLWLRGAGLTLTALLGVVNTTCDALLTSGATTTGFSPLVDGVLGISGFNPLNGVFGLGNGTNFINGPVAAPLPGTIGFGGLGTTPISGLGATTSGATGVPTSGTTGGGFAGTTGGGVGGTTGGGFGGTTGGGVGAGGS